MYLKNFTLIHRYLKNWLDPWMKYEFIWSVFQIQFYTVHYWHRLKVIRKSNKLRCPCRPILNWPAFCDFWKKPRNTTLLGYTYLSLKHQLHFNAYFCWTQEEKERRAKTKQQRREYEATVDVGDHAWFQQRRFLDLEDLSFQQGSHFMSNRKCHLPDGSTRQQKKGGFGYFVSFYTPLSTKFNFL